MMLAYNVTILQVFVKFSYTLHTEKLKYSDHDLQKRFFSWSFNSDQTEKWQC